MERNGAIRAPDHTCSGLPYPAGGYRPGLKARDIIENMNADFPIRYVDPVFRPPSEAESLILPVTDGCSWNQCTFCEMYTAPQKKFRARDEEETLETLRRCGERFGATSAASSSPTATRWCCRPGAC
jgi:radical SAM superfamily enzyme YgiQ (UPF0313 family)